MEAVSFESVSSTLPVMLLPLQTDNMIVPDTMVAEIKNSVSIEVKPDSPEWFIGYFEWRGHKLPLVSFEALNGAMAIPADAVSRVVILKSMATHGHLPFYGVVIDDVPDVIEMTDDMVSIHDGRPRGRAEAMSVAFGEKTGGIPNTDWVEQHLLTYILHG